MKNLVFETPPDAVRNRKQQTSPYRTTRYFVVQNHDKIISVKRTYRDAFGVIQKTIKEHLTKTLGSQVMPDRFCNAANEVLAKLDQFKTINEMKADPFCREIEIHVLSFRIVDIVEKEEG